MAYLRCAGQASPGSALSTQVGLAWDSLLDPPGLPWMFVGFQAESQAVERVLVRVQVGLSFPLAQLLPSLTPDTQSTWSLC